MGTEQIWSFASNAAFLAVGGLAVYEQAEAWLFFAIACAVLAIGSGLFHWLERRGWPLREQGRLADRAGIFAVFSVLALMGVGLAEWSLILPLWAALGYWLRDLHMVLTTIVLGVLALSGLLHQGLYAEAGVVLGLFGIAAGIREMGGPSSWYHGAWHIIAACAIAGLYGSLAGLA